jgi:excisionase family DNA binding protein
MTPPGGALTGGGDPLVVSVAEAARMLGISKTLAYALVAREELPSVRVGGRVKVPRRAVERLTESRVEPAPDRPRPVESIASRGPDRSARPASHSRTDDSPAPARPRVSNRRDPDPHPTTQLSLFEISLPAPTPTETEPHTTPPALTTSEPGPYRVLPPSNRPDALAPGVRRGRVNVVGNEAGERSALNENLNDEATSPC